MLFSHKGILGGAHGEEEDNDHKWLCLISVWVTWPSHCHYYLVILWGLNEL